MTTEEKIAVMQACLDNKTIEIKSKTEKEWNTCDFEPLWNWLKYEYRIKSEYIPFDFSDAQNLIGKVVKSKHSKNIFLITGYDISEKYFIVGNTTQTFYQLFNNCEFLDGSPCGKLKQ